MLILGQQVAAKWKSLHDQYVHCKNSSKGKSGDGFGEEIKVEVFNLMTFLDVMLEKWKYAIFYNLWMCIIK